MLALASVVASAAIDATSYRKRADILAEVSWAENECTMTQVAYKYPTDQPGVFDEFMLVTAPSDCIDPAEPGRDWMVCENVTIGFSPHCVTTRPVLEVELSRAAPQIGDTIVAFASGDPAGGDPNVHQGTLWTGTLGGANATSFAFSASGHQMSLMRGAPAVSLCGGFGVVYTDSATLGLAGTFALAVHQEAISACLLAIVNGTCDMRDAERRAIPSDCPATDV